MSVVINQPVNTLPVLTYRWLKLNELKLSEPIGIPIKPYSKQFVANLDAVKQMIEIELVLLLRRFRYWVREFRLS